MDQGAEQGECFVLLVSKRRKWLVLVKSIKVKQADICAEGGDSRTKTWWIRRWDRVRFDVEHTVYNSELQRTWGNFG